MGELRKHWDDNTPQELIDELNRIAADLGKLPRAVRRITLSPKAAARLREAMRVEGLDGIEVVSNARIHSSAKILEYTDGNVEMHFRGKVIPLGKSDMWPAHEGEVVEWMLWRMRRMRGGE